MQNLLVVTALFGLASAKVFDQGFYSYYLASHSKMYSPQETEYRSKIFAENIKKIQEINDSNLGWYAGLTEFTDWTWEEFKNYFLMSPQNCSATVSEKRVYVADDLPDSYDWRDYGKVSIVKNQGQCGSCWTFSTTGAMESHYAIYNNQTATTLFAEQQLVDCAQGFNNYGCNGGLPSQAFEYIQWQKGITTEVQYPYTAQDGTCDLEGKKLVGHAPGGSYNITAGDENELQYELVKSGPISVAFDVVDDFMHYTGGVYRSSSCGTLPSQVNHAVLAVGYGVQKVDDEDVEYWLVKNSWGTDWGLDGYFKILKGNNECGISDCASRPILKV